MSRASPESQADDQIRPIIWKDNSLHLLDQRLLPGAETYLELTSPDEVARAIENLVVRGAPAIGITAAYGVVLAMQQYSEDPPALDKALQKLRDARPTAVNLSWAVARMQQLIDDGVGISQLVEAADRMLAEDIAANQAMGRAGAAVLAQSDTPIGVLTHCNTGSLATGGFGTALGVIRQAWSEELLEQVYASETRPWLQGSRLTAWELQRDGIPSQLICDSAASALMAQGLVSWVITGADRVTANGDVINKIGTLSHAVNARHHGIKFMVVAPTSTVDIHTPSGDAVKIEIREGTEITHPAGVASSPENTRSWNPVFDVTPAALIDVLVTEAGVLHRPDSEGIRELMT